MTKVLAILKHSPAACAFCLSIGIGSMLSVAYVDPQDRAAITKRQAVGSVLLLLPGLAHKFYDEETQQG
jgi:hypothetical protein